MSSTIDFTSMVTCSCCGQIVAVHEARLNHTNDIICNECIEEHYERCRICGEYHLAEEVTEIGGDYYCDECRDRRFAQCEHCGEWTRRYDISYVFTDPDDPMETERWCDDCRRDDAFYCYECGGQFDSSAYEQVHYEGGELCRSCYDRKVRETDINYWKAPTGIQSYSYKPRACFCPAPDQDEIFYGYELEMEANGCDDKNDAADMVNNDIGYTYCKRDGSLDDGMELVSHPATLHYHMDKKPVYEEVFKYLTADGWRSHEAGTCGLHVHISRKAMARKNRYAVANLLLFFDYHWDKFLKFSRRTQSQLERWAQRYETKGIDYVDLEDDAYGKDDRYMTINLQNSNTVEIRMFRGTLNVETFMATLQLVDVVVRKAIELGYDFDAATSINWNDLVKSDHEELNAYLERRGLLNMENGEPESIIDDPECDSVSEEPKECRDGFMIGDRVTINIPYDNGGYNSLVYNLHGQTLTGTVVAFNTWDAHNTIGVRFDIEHDGLHELDGHCTRRHGQWCRVQDLAHMHPTEEDVGRTVRIDPEFTDGVGNETRGLPGIMRGIEGDDCAIEMTVEFNGHSCNGRCRFHQGHWVNAEHVYLTEEM